MRLLTSAHANISHVHSADARENIATYVMSCCCSDTNRRTAENTFQNVWSHIGQDSFCASTVDCEMLQEHFLPCATSFNAQLACHCLMCSGTYIHRMSIWWDAFLFHPEHVRCFVTFRITNISTFKVGTTKCQQTLRMDGKRLQYFFVDSERIWTEHVVNYDCVSEWGMVVVRAIPVIGSNDWWSNICTLNVRTFVALFSYSIQWKYWIRLKWKTACRKNNSMLFADLLAHAYFFAFFCWCACFLWGAFIVCLFIRLQCRATSAPQSLPFT